MNKSRKHNRRETTVGEIHRTREKISETFGGDIHAIMEDARRRQERSGRRTVSCEETVQPGDEGTG